LLFSLFPSAAIWYPVPNFDMTCEPHHDIPETGLGRTVRCYQSVRYNLV
jgi:hypothetical protein